MPRKRIAAVQKRNWLRRHEEGEPQEEIATKDGVNRRTVREGIERARQERDFEAAQREQLRDALRAHQEDLLHLLKQIRLVVQVLEIAPSGLLTTRDFGLEDLEPPPERDNAFDVPFYVGGTEPTWERISADPAAFYLKRTVGGPTEVAITDEGGRLWISLREHIGGKDPLWRHVAEWRQALLADAQARASLNREIAKQAQKLFGMKMRMVPGNGPRLTPALAWFVRSWTTRRALGVANPNLKDVVKPVANRIEADYGGFTVALVDLALDGAMAEDTVKMKVLDAAKALARLIESIAARSETARAAEAYRDVETRTKRVWDDTEGYLLLHHVPGRCKLCKRLGGQ